MGYSIGVDVGGTFTDFLLTDDTGRRRQHKTPSVPSDPAAGVLTGLSELAAAEGMGETEFLASVHLIVHGTTVATNAVLTGSGARTGLVTTAGLRDILEMRRGIRSRRHLYDNKYVAPEPLVPRDRRVVVQERMTAAGEVHQELDEESLRSAVSDLVDSGVEAIAVCFAHSYANPEHELRAREVVQARAPGAFLSLSSEVLPQIRLYPRVSTTVMNAYLGPVVQRYMSEIVGRLAGRGFTGTLMVMQSNGGITRPETVAHLPATITLSGPAAGPVAALEFIRRIGRRDCTVVDMGGTSYDASLVLNGEVQVSREGEINRQVIALPTTHVHTIGSGGGSIARIDEGGLLQVGPRSAGAVPGPAAYGRGGTEPTVSDADLVLGYLDPDYFLGGRQRLRPDLAEAAVRTVAEPLGLDVVEAAAGIYELVNLQMAAGTKNVSVERGHDPRSFPMVVAGGAGPVHAGMIAHELGIPTVLIPRLSSVLCAAGMLMADLRHDFVRGCNGRLSELDLGTAAALVAEMRAEGEKLLAQEGIAQDRREHVVSADVRYPGQHHEVTVTIDATDLDPAVPERALRVAEAFHDRHRSLYGFAEPDQEVELMSLRVSAVGHRQDNGTSMGGDPVAAGTPSPKGNREAYLRSAGRKVVVPVYEGADLPLGVLVEGPVIVEEPTTTIFVPEYFDIVSDPSGSYVMTAKGTDRAAADGKGDGR